MVTFDQSDEFKKKPKIFISIMANNGEVEDYSKLPAEHPRKLIPELCRLFYQLGWVTGY
jgi:hypothetical protein